MRSNAYLLGDTYDLMRGGQLIAVHASDVQAASALAERSFGAQSVGTVSEPASSVLARFGALTMLARRRRAKA